jgi:hypothetical protein
MFSPPPLDEKYDERRDMASTRDPQENGGASRRRRSFWFDPRFAVGLILVVVSVLGVVGLVGAANASVDVLAARTTLTPGERVHVADLIPTSVRADQTDELYLRAADVPAAGIIVTRAVAAGELVPQSAVGSEAGKKLTSVVVSVNTALAASVVPGARVDLWSAQQVAGGVTGGDSHAAPTVLVPSATILRLVDQKSVVATQGSAVELLVPKSATASVLDAIANGAALSVVPVDLPLGK